ncbi:MAG: PqiC family protein [Proteobacteria bacterium]|nr:PqiC family protein [Pseudomonadota bacterium]MBU1545819.1 PqiC family protein [Pseudomonadota bacterium]MBU2618341.1 PqiC family protein [Pseudomonadota bacterium]
MKNMPGTRKSAFLIFLAGILLLAGCARTIPVSYYQLSALEPARTAPVSAEAGTVVLGIGPVRLPEYLDRPQLVTRMTPNRLHLADSHRWAEPLGENIPRVVGENLSALLGTDRILLHPWPVSRTTDYQVMVQVLHFENESDGGARLVALWSVKGKDGAMVLPEKRSSHSAPAASRDQEGKVAALNAALGSFCREVAQALTPVLGNL